MSTLALYRHIIDGEKLPDPPDKRDRPDKGKGKGDKDKDKGEGRGSITHISIMQHTLGRC